MSTMSSLLAMAPFGLDGSTKDAFLTDALRELTCHHVAHCPSYRRMLEGIGFDPKTMSHYTDIPPLPVRLFKEMDLLSVPRSNVFKTMTSSGTTGQAVSRIYLDRDAAGEQQRALVRVVSDFIGSRRLPMVIVDSPSVVKDRAMFSARGAGVLGFSIFGSERIYALNDSMQLDVNGVREFLSRYHGGPILLFGFTFMVWKHFLSELLRMGRPFDLSKGILIHGGGWKKLASESVSPEQFRRQVRDACGTTRIHDYYGMVEQTGSICMECEQGHLHASVWSDVVPRRAADFRPCENREPGILQVVSILPRSYPGHCLLSEDQGEVLGQDDCPCGRKGKYFRVLGRLESAEMRGCSDTYVVPS